MRTGHDMGYPRLYSCRYYDTANTTKNPAGERMLCDVKVRPSFSSLLYYKNKGFRTDLDRFCALCYISLSVLAKSEWLVARRQLGSLDTSISL